MESFKFLTLETLPIKIFAILNEVPGIMPACGQTGSNGDFISPDCSFNGSLFFKNEKLVYIILFSIKRHLSKSMPFI
jgi:hypothetical protein